MTDIQPKYSEEKTLEQNIFGISHVHYNAYDACNRQLFLVHGTKPITHIRNLTFKVYKSKVIESGNGVYIHMDRAKLKI